MPERGEALSLKPLLILSAKKKDESFFHQGSSVSFKLVSKCKCNIQVHDAFTKHPWERLKSTKMKREQFFSLMKEKMLRVAGS